MVNNDVLRFKVLNSIRNKFFTSNPTKIPGDEEPNDRN